MTLDSAANGPAPGETVGTGRRRYPPDLAQFVQEASIGVALLEANGVVRWCNRTEHERLGLQREQFIGRPYRDFFVAPEDCDKLLDRILEGAVVSGEVVTLRSASGSVRYVAIDADAAPQDDGVHIRLLTRDVTAERTTQEESRRQGAMLNAVGQAVVGTDTSGIVTYWNAAAERMFGIPAAEALGRDVFQLVTMEGPQPSGDEIVAAYARGLPWSGELEVKRPDGSRLSVFVTETPLLDAEGQVVGFVGVSADISALKAAAGELRARERRLEALAESLPAMVVLASNDRGFYYFNRMFQAYTGLAAAPDVPQWQELIHPDDFPGLRDGFQRVLRGRTLEREARIRRHDGEFRWFLIRAVPLAPSQGEPGTAVITAVDIMDIRIAAQRLESARNQLETILRGITDGVTAHDRLGRMVFANAAAARLLGFDSVDELLSAPLSGVLSNFEVEDQDGRSLEPGDLPGARVMRGEHPEEQLLAFKSRTTGDVRYSLVKAAPIHDSAGNLEYVVDIFSDVTGTVLAAREREELLRREREARISAERTAYRLAALQEVTASLAGALTQQQIAEVIVSSGVFATGAQAAVVALLEGEEVAVLATAATGDQSPPARRRFRPDEDFPIAEAISTCEEVFLCEVSEREGFPGITGKAWAALPLRAEDRCIGAVCFIFQKEQEFSEQDREVMRTLARLCSHALDRARLYELESSLRSQAQEYADLLLRVQQVTDAALSHPDLSELPQILEAIRDVVEADTISIFLLDDERRELVAEASVGLERDVELGVRVPVGEGFIGRIAETRKPVIVEEPADYPFAEAESALRELGSIAGIPLVVEGKVTGVLHVGLRQGHSIEQRHVRLLELVADRVAQAVAQSRLFQAERAARAEAEEVRNRVTRLQATTSRLAGAWTQAEAAAVVLEEGLRHLRPETIVLALARAGGGFEVLGSQGYSDSALAAIAALEPSDLHPLNDLVAGAGPLFFSSIEEFRRRYPLSRATRKVSSATACLPLRARDRVLGGVMVGFKEPREFAEADRSYILAVVQQCALALARAQLYDAESEARAEAQDAEARYRTLAEAMPQIVWTATADGSIDYYNERFYEFTGLEPGEAEGWAWQGLVHPDDEARVTAAWRRSLETGEQFELESRIRRADGSYCWVLERALPLRDASGRITRWLGTVTDIDAQKRAQERFGFLAEASATLSSSLDFEETLRTVARLAVPVLADWCAVHIKDAEGAPMRLVIAGMDQTKWALAERMEVKEPLSTDAPFGYAYVLRTGRPQLIPEVAANPMSLDLGERGGADFKSAICVPVLVRGHVMAAISLATAESGRRYNERDLETAIEFARHVAFAVENALLYRESQQIQEELRLANEAKDEFLGLMSHELRTPITTIFGGAKILRSRGRFLDEEHRESLLRDIETEAEGMHRMIEDLLVLARTGSGEQVSTEPILANRLVDKVVRGFQLHRPGRRILVSSDRDVLPVMAEATYLEQVLRNLLSNADKYSPPGLPIEVQIKGAGEEVIVSVLDRGSGIDPEEAELVFTRFYRAEKTARNVRGMGLGLTVCKKLVEAQGGRIWAKPREGGGTELSFALPAFTAAYDDV